MNVSDLQFKILKYDIVCDAAHCGSIYTKKHFSQTLWVSCKQSCFCYICLIEFSAEEFVGNEGGNWETEKIYEETSVR